MSAVRSVQIGAEIVDLGATKDVFLAIQADLAALKATVDALVADDGGSTTGDPAVGTLKTQA